MERGVGDKHSLDPQFHLQNNFIHNLILFSQFSSLIAERVGDSVSAAVLFFALFPVVHF